MSFEVLREVKRANDQAREDERERQAKLGAVTPNSPMQSPTAWGVPRDTASGTPGYRRGGRGRSSA